MNTLDVFLLPITNNVNNELVHHTLNQFCFMLNMQHQHSRIILITSELKQHKAVNKLQ